MRVSSKMLHTAAVNALLNRQKSIGKAQNQLATGRRILSPADDPSGSTRILNLKKSVQVKEQYLVNIGTARQYSGFEEQTLSAVQNAIQRIRELAIQGNNDSQTAVSRKTIASEVKQQLESLLASANTRNANGEYIFSGFKGNTQPFSRDASGAYVYSGDQGQRLLQITEGRQIATGNSGSEVFLQLKNGNGIFTARDNASNAGTGVIDPGSVINSSLVDGDSYNITFANTTTATGTLTFNDAIGVNDDLSYTLNINGINVYSVAESGTPIASLTDLANQINLSVGTTNVRAIVTGGALQLANTSPNAGDIVINESLSGFTPGDGDALTGYFASNLTEANNSNTITLAQSGANYYLVEDSAGNIEASGAYQEGGAISFNGLQTNIKGSVDNGDIFTVSPSTNQSLFQTVQNLVDALEGGASGPTSLTNFHNTVSQFLTDIDQATDNITNIRASLGGRLNVLDSEENSNTDLILELRQTVSVIEDLDYTEAISSLNFQLTGLEAVFPYLIISSNFKLVARTSRSERRENEHPIFPCFSQLPSTLRILVF